jgi:hypothetical protein
MVEGKSSIEFLEKWPSFSCRQGILYFLPNKRISLAWYAQRDRSINQLIFGHYEPDILAKVTAHGEEISVCKLKIPSHLSCYQFYQDEHAHLHNAQFPCNT